MKIASFVIEQRVIIKASKGRIVIEPAEKLELKLEDLVAGITRENIHDELDFGRPIGKEAL
jgi:antitoxin MazE